MPMGSIRSSPPVKAPHFFRIIVNSSLLRLRFPRNFVNKYGKNLANHVYLKVPNGAVWKVELIKSDEVFRLCSGWKEFTEYYSVDYGHFLVFRYDGNSNFHVLIFDMTGSEIEYPIGAPHGVDADINHIRNSQVPETEECIEVDDDSVEMLEDFPTYETRREEIPERNGSGKDVPTEIFDGGPRRQTTWKLVSLRTDIEKYVSVDISDDPTVPDPPSSQTMRTNKTEECTGGPSTAHRFRQSPLPVRKPSASDRYAALQRVCAFKSENPYFTVYMQQYNISNVYIPRNFANNNLSREENHVTLRVSDGRTWSVKRYCDRNGRLILRWIPFARDNFLKVGDVCVFELINKSIKPACLNVTIFRE